MLRIATGTAHLQPKSTTQNLKESRTPMQQDRAKHLTDVKVKVTSAEN